VALAKQVNPTGKKMLAQTNPIEVADLLRRLINSKPDFMKNEETKLLYLELKQGLENYLKTKVN
jgi:hypothetical protein